MIRLVISGLGDELLAIIIIVIRLVISEWISGLVIRSVD